MNFLKGLVLAVVAVKAVISSSDYLESKDNWKQLDHQRSTRHASRDLQLTTPHTIRISAGATESWIDQNGLRWESDNLLINQGSVHSICPLEITNTTLDALYCKERYFDSLVHTQPFRYDLTVPRNGTYTVRLHFAEIHYKAIGERLFDVWVGGKLAIKSLDIYKEVGFATAYIFPLTTKPSRNVISIELVPRKGNPKICAIEIVESSGYIKPPIVAFPVSAPKTAPVASSLASLAVAVPVEAPNTALIASPAATPVSATAGPPKTAPAVFPVPKTAPVVAIPVTTPAVVVPVDRKSTRLNSSHSIASRMPSSA